MGTSLQILLEENKELGRLNTWKLEGTAKYYAAPKNVQEVQELVRFAGKDGLPILPIGNGSNLFVDNHFFEGIVIHLNKHMKSIVPEEDKNEIFAYAGMALPALATKMANSGIEGFDFFAGIPGTVGGAIAMNAGCLGKDTKGLLKSVVFIDEHGEVIEEPVKKLGMDFRTSRFLYTSSIIIGGYFHYRQSDSPEEVRQLTKKAMNIRRDKFPKGVATVGSTFKSHPNGPFPGKLIEEAGLKGYTCNNAKISDKHGNWIINTGAAGTGDVSDLMSTMYSQVLSRSDVKMEPEVIFISDYIHGKHEAWYKLLSK